MTDSPELGFVGLGQMGGPMADNIVKGGFGLICFDIAGTEKLMPEGGVSGNSLREVCEKADTVFLSLPDGKIVDQVVRDIVNHEAPRVSLVVDLSTIGPEEARNAAATLKEAGIGYVDAPVSGGRAGAIAGTITLIWAGPEAELKRHRPVIDAFCGNPFHVGDKAGQGQAVKLLNNFLSATALAASSEAVLYGLSQGVEMKTILDVVNVSTGMNTATRDKFPQRIMTGSYDAGFYAELLNKDVQLYIDNVKDAGTPGDIGEVIASIWQGITDVSPKGTDITRIYDFIRERGS